MLFDFLIGEQATGLILAAQRGKKLERLRNDHRAKEAGLLVLLKNLLEEICLARANAFLNYALFFLTVVKQKKKGLAVVLALQKSRDFYNGFIERGKMLKKDFPYHRVLVLLFAGHHLNRCKNALKQLLIKRSISSHENHTCNDGQ